METMSKNTSSLASLCTRYIRLQDSIKQDYFFDESIALQDIMETISSNIGGEVFFVNANGKIIVANSNAVYATEGKFIDYEVVKKTILNDKYYDETDLGGVFKQNHYIYGQPVYIGNQLVCIAFTTADTSEYYQFTYAQYISCFCTYNLCSCNYRHWYLYLLYGQAPASDCLCRT